MSPTQSSDVTRLLTDVSAGRRGAYAELLPLVYAELRALADRALRHERRGHTLQPTALVHEAYLKLVEQRDVHWQHRVHFFRLAAQLMRRILVDHARARQTIKRGGGRTRIALDAAVSESRESEVDLVALDDCLARLESLDERQARIIEMRFFAGLTIEETAALLEISPATVKREWTLARAWLYRELSDL